MEAKKGEGGERTDECACAASAAAGDALETLSCAARREVPSPEEQRILNRILTVQHQGRLLKEEIERLRGTRPVDSQALAEAEAALASLRGERAALEEQRLAAAHERMRRLGHA
jgi:hypothetical protein